MLNPIVRCPKTGKVRHLSLHRSFKTDHIVWWYAGMLKNRESTVPNVIVYFRPLDRQGNVGELIPVSVGLTNLGLLRIGSIWRDGICRSEAVLKTERFYVDFTRGRWRFNSPMEAWKNNNENPINQDEYPLPYSRDRNWLIEFSLNDRQNLIIPCLEFFSRYYGRSQEVKRVLATYRWDEVERRLYAPIDLPQRQDLWQVKLSTRTRNGDTTFLAHILYDNFSRRAAKSIYAQIESSFEHGGKLAFVKAGPWFQGPAQIWVNGLWMNNGQTFLGLQVAGGSDPGGVPIARDRENTNKVLNAADGDHIPEAWGGAPMRVVSPLPNIVDLTDYDEPDHGSATVDVEEPDFITLGVPRTIIDVKRQRAISAAGIRGKDGLSNAFSSGEPYGNEKGVGHSSIHASQVMESHGVLRDMWDALLFLKSSQPDLIQSAEWFTFEDGFRSDPEPRLISLHPFVADSAEGSKVNPGNWSYYDIAEKILRGVLVLRVRAKCGLLYIVEIQRRPQKRNENGVSREAEESFRGLAFVLDDQSQFEEWLRELLSAIPEVKGVLQNLVRKCPGKAAAFKHSRAKDELVPCTAAVSNALRKVSELAGRTSDDS